MSTTGFCKLTSAKIPDTDATCESLNGGCAIYNLTRGGLAMLYGIRELDIGTGNGLMTDGAKPSLVFTNHQVVSDSGIHFSPPSTPG